MKLTSSHRLILLLVAIMVLFTSCNYWRQCCKQNSTNGYMDAAIIQAYTDSRFSYYPLDSISFEYDTPQLWMRLAPFKNDSLVGIIEGHSFVNINGEFEGIKYNGIYLNKAKSWERPRGPLRILWCDDSGNTCKCTGLKSQSRIKQLNLDNQVLPFLQSQRIYRYEHSRKAVHKLFWRIYIETSSSAF